MSSKLDPITQAIRIQTERTQQQEHSTPLYLTSSFIFDEAEAMRAAFADENEDNIYSRFSNPNVDEFIAKMCALEGAEDGFATSTGMSAIFGSFFALLKQGDHIISCSSVFGSTFTLVTKYLPRYGITCTLVPANDEAAWEAAVQPNTKMIYLETPTNPQLEILDLEWAGKFSKKHNLILNVDNCFATPLLQKPIQYGADLVVHSATKWIDGQGRVLGGIIVGRADLIKEIYLFCRNTGPALAPFNAWVLSKSLETLDVRMQRHCENALKVA
ncbi:MAG: O-succinylhomoserine sulfhydrylase, partial [Mucilaginibacter sp.]|nr:O-succinylhomoserine sulfhydrylase [Mucilaginibacter sp.]